MKKNTSRALVLAGLGAAVAAGVLKRTGLFNTALYSSEHKALSRYVESHYSGAAYSPIRRTEEGYLSVVTLPGGRRIVLTFTKACKGIYIFSEKPVKE